MLPDKTLLLFSQVHTVPNPPVVQAMIERMVTPSSCKTLAVVKSSHGMEKESQLFSEGDFKTHLLEGKPHFETALKQNPASAPACTKG